MRRGLFFISILICLFLIGNGQSSSFSNIHFEHYDASDGLPINNIFNITQDHNGFIWVAGLGGVYRYDGKAFVEFRYNPDIPNSIGGTVFRQVYETNNGNLWFTSGDAGISILDKEKGVFIRFYNHEKASGILVSNDTKTVLEDNKGNLWITTAKGLMKWDATNQQFDPVEYKIVDSPNLRKTSGYHLKDMVEGDNGYLWMIGLNARLGLLRFNPENYELKAFPLPIEKNLGRASWTEDIYLDSKGMIWIACRAGLYTFNPYTNQIKSYLHEARKSGSISSNEVLCVLEDHEGNIWIGTINGLNKLDKETQTFEVFKHAATDPFSISAESVQSLFEDAQGNLWIGTKEGGLNRMVERKERFGIFDLESAFDHLRDGAVYSVGQDRSGKIWVGTISGKVFSFDHKTGQLEYFPFPEEIQMLTDEKQVFGMEESSDGWIWMSVEDYGILKFDPLSGTYTSYSNYILPSPWQPDNYVHRVLDIIEDRKGTVWLGTRNNGLGRFFPETGQFKWFRPIPDNQPIRPNYQIFQLIEDQKGNIWGVFSNGGIFCHDPLTEQFTYYKYEEGNPNSLATNKVRTIYQDREGMIWIGTFMGLDRLDPITGKINHFREKQGLINGKVLNIQEDLEGNLWLGTERGLYHFDMNAQVFRKFDDINGLNYLDFNPATATIDPKSGKIFFGMTNGILEIQPNTFRSNTYQPLVHLSKLTYFLRNDPDQPIEDLWIGNKAFLELSYDARVVEFEIASSNFLSPIKNEFAYALMDGNKPPTSKDWIQLGTNHTIRLVELPPNTYHLYTKTSNNGNVWSESNRQLEIVIHPPWWRSKWAYGVYFILFILGVTGLYRFQLTRQLEKQQIQQLRELDAFKQRFYANITHELRTPLTLIMGPIQSLLERDSLEKKDHIYLELVKENAWKLLKRVNEILDLSKLDAKKMKLNEQPVQVHQFMQKLVFHHQPTAEHKEIELRLRNEISNPLVCLLDRDKLETILTNYISNALKHTDRGGAIDLIVKKSNAKLEFAVADSGRGINKSDLPYIFDRYYQAKNALNQTGTGIGLAFCKELAELMKGEVGVKSELGEGSTFYVKVPCKVVEGGQYSGYMMQGAGYKTQGTEATLNKSEQFKITPNNSEQAQTILLVEDNPDLRTYISEELRDYHVIQTENGEEALNILADGGRDEKNLPLAVSLIISDIMMPKMDGHELLKKLKAHDKWQKIPVIMLTALANEQSKLKALRTGVDDYLTKPFSPSELKARVANLLNNYQLRKEFLQTEPKEEQEQRKPVKVEASFEEVPEADQIWLAKLEAEVKTALENELQLSAIELADRMALSQRQLLRRIKTLTGLPTNKYIQEIKLQKARHLLENNAFPTIAEVAYSSGFDTPKYFSKLFANRFGKSPSEYLRGGK